MKTIIVTQNIAFNSDREEYRDTLDQRLIQFVLAAQFIPFAVPNNLLKKLPKDSLNAYLLDTWLNHINPDGIILSGGNNLGEYWERDCTEKHLIDYAKQRNLPLLALCRGMQLLGKTHGAQLKKISDHCKTRHRISGIINQEVNSYHRFVLATCPTDFITLATSEDQEIEAISHRDLPWQGWMWHPEREKEFNVNDITRFKNLFKG